MCVLLVCVGLVSVSCDGSSADAAPHAGRIAIASNSSAGWDRKVRRSITVRNSEQTTEAMELATQPKIHYRVNSTITHVKNISNRSAKAGKIPVDENTMEDTSLDTETVVHISSPNMNNIEPATASNIVDNNNITSGKEWNQVDTDVASAAREEALGLTNIQKSYKRKIRIWRNSSSKDDDKMTRSENAEMGNESITNEEYITNMSSKNACNILFSVVITDWKMFPNGSLLSLDDKPVLYPPEYFWKEQNDYNETKVRGCLCLLRNCIRKCCPEGHTLTEKKECPPSNLTLLHPFEPQFIDEDTNSLVTTVDVHILYGDPCSKESYRLDPQTNEEDQFSLLLSGILRAPEFGNFTVAEYCIEAFEEKKAILPLLCFDEEESDFSTKDKEIHLLYPIGLIISVPFLFATFVVYAVIPELRNLHGKCLMCQVTSLLTAYVFLVIVQLGGDQLSHEFCVSCGKCSWCVMLSSRLW